MTVVEQRVAAEDLWRRFGCKMHSIVRMMELPADGESLIAEAKKANAAVQAAAIKQRKEAVEAAAAPPPLGMGVSNEYGAIPTGVREEEWDASDTLRAGIRSVMKLQRNLAKTFRRPLTPLETKATRVFTSADVPPPVAQSSVRFDRHHHGQARRGKLALKQLEDEPHSRKKQAAFKQMVNEISRSRYVLDAPVARGAAIYPDPVWGVEPERLRSPPTTLKRQDRVQSSVGTEFAVGYHVHRGQKIKSHRPLLPAPRGKSMVNIHKLLPDSHFALGNFHQDDGPDCWRENDETRRIRYYKQGGGAYQRFLEEHPPPPPAEKDDSDEGEEDPKDKGPPDDWAPGGIYHHLIFGGPSDDELVRMMSADYVEEADDTPNWLDAGFDGNVIDGDGEGGGGDGEGSGGEGEGEGGGGGGDGGDGGDGGVGSSSGGAAQSSVAFKKAFGFGGGIWGSVDAGTAGDPEFRWLDRSMWAPRKHGPQHADSCDYVDTRPMLNSAFWTVWEGTSGYAFTSSKDPTPSGRALGYQDVTKDLIREVVRTLEKWYPMLLRIFTYYSCIGAEVTNSIEGMASAGYALFISDAKLDSEAPGRKARFAKTRGEDGWDLLWVAVNSSKESQEQGAWNSVMRFTRGEFLEFIIRACNDSGRRPQGELCAAIEAFCTDLLFFLSEAPEADLILHRPDEFRRQYCYTRETSAMLSHHLPSLRSIFEIYAEKGTGGPEPDGATDMMSAAQWFALMRDLGLAKECGVRQLHLIFAQSRMAVIDEARTRAHQGQLTQLPFEGFCEAMVRLAMLKALPSDKEMKKNGFCFPGEYVGAILTRGMQMYEAWVKVSKRRNDIGRGDPIFGRVDMLLLLVVSVVQFGVEQQVGGPTLLLRGHPDELLSLEEVNRYWKSPTRNVFEGGAAS